MGLFLVYVRISGTTKSNTNHTPSPKQIDPYETVVEYFLFDVTKLGAWHGPLSQPYLGQPTNEFSYLVRFYIFFYPRFLLIFIFVFFNLFFAISKILLKCTLSINFDMHDLFYIMKIFFLFVNYFIIYRNSFVTHGHIFRYV